MVEREREREREGRRERTRAGSGEGGREREKGGEWGKAVRNVGRARAPRAPARVARPGTPALRSGASGRAATRPRQYDPGRPARPERGLAVIINGTSLRSAAGPLSAIRSIAGGRAGRGRLLRGSRGRSPRAGDGFARSPDGDVTPRRPTGRDLP